MGRVNWERRLPLAVLHDVSVAHAGASRLEAEVGGAVADAVLGSAFLLEGLARAYLREVPVALARLVEADRRRALTVEGALQLLLAAEPDFPEASMWAVSRLPEHLLLGGRAGALQLRAQRRRLLHLLAARAGHVRES